MSVISKIITADLYRWEAVLSDHIHSGESDWADVISEALGVIQIEMSNRKIKTRLLGTKLQIVADTLTGIENSNLSEEDFAERARLVLTVDTLDEEITPVAQYILQGTNDGGVSYDTVVSEQTATATGEATHAFLDVHKKYRLQVTNAVAVVSDVYLMERSFELPHIYLSLAMAFKSIKNDPDGVYDQKGDDYMDRYDKSITEMSRTYDSNEDGNIVDEEIDNDQEITFI